MTPPHLRCGRFELSLARPLLMGIVNLTDDSFSGDGLADDVARAIEHGRQLVVAGAQLLDLGGESSRPGAAPVSTAQELARVLPVLEGLRDCGVPLSVDTVKPEVMRATLAAGADMINDITALQMPGALAAVAESSCALCLMHMQGEPRTMQRAPFYDDVVGEVADFFRARIAATDRAGVARDRIVLDPGFGFGKTLEHNLVLLRQLATLAVDGLPLLVGLSRKSMLGALTGRPAHERVPASVAAALLAVQRGAAIVRVHDVCATRDALAVLDALQAVGGNPHRYEAMNQ
ncbi:MAG: dihydropteroate synthase [Sterolibacterium sp.]|nr:dihydropteroate synthase [Sterolibacterium sp.]